MRYAAFLRAINVGTHNRIKMAELREVCLKAGLTNVSTYLQTGNILFDFEGDSETAATTIEAALTAHGLRNAPAVVRTREELAELLALDVFEAFPADAFRQYVTLFRNPLPQDLPETAHDVIHVAAVREREVLTAMPLERPQGLDINGFLSKATRMEGTTRYWHVVAEVGRLLG